MDLHSYRRGRKVTEFAESFIMLVDGHYYDIRMPDHLVDLAPHHRDDTEDERRAKAKKYDERRAYQWVPHGRPDADGYQRLISPWERGTLWSYAANLRHRARRHAKNVEYMALDDSVDYPPATVTVPPEEARPRQPFPYGGKRWRAAYGRRATVEGSFAGTNDTFTQVSRRGWKRTLGAV